MAWSLIIPMSMWVARLPFIYSTIAKRFPICPSQNISLPPKTPSFAPSIAMKRTSRNLMPSLLGIETYCTFLIHYNSLFPTKFALSPRPPLKNAPFLVASLMLIKPFQKVSQPTCIKSALRSFAGMKNMRQGIFHSTA